MMKDMVTGELSYAYTVFSYDNRKDKLEKLFVVHLTEKQAENFTAKYSTENVIMTVELAESRGV